MDFFRKARKLRVRVAGFIQNEKQEILLIQQKKKDKEYWLLPGGGIEFGETAQKALARELKEELDISFKEPEFLLINETIDPKGKRHLIQIVFKVEISSSEIKIKDKALVQYGYFLPKDILQMDIRPNIKEYIEKICENSLKETPCTFISTNWVEDE